MSVKEHLEKKRIKNFEVTIDGYEFEGELNKHNCWEMRGTIGNGVEATFKTPPRWGYSRVMQFLGNVVEARVV